MTRATRQRTWLRLGLLASALLAFGLAILLLVTDRARSPNVVLITVDTLRADRLGCYGSNSTRTPNLDRLAAEGTLFENAATPMPLTRPSHFSIMTSLHPRDHGVVNNAISLSGDVTTLAEVYAEAGYRTAAFVAVALLAPDSGAAQGFSRFEAPRGAHERSAESVVPQAAAWLRETSRREPFFLWVHLFEPHMPYAPPAADRPAPPPRLPALSSGFSWPLALGLAEQNGGDLPQDVFDWALALYDGEVDATDRWVGRLIEVLEELEVLDDTVVAFTADHGECFENGVFFEHAGCLHDGSVSVPLLFRYPPRIAGGSRLAGSVDHLDIAPTLLELTGQRIPAEFRGRPLFDSQPDGEHYSLLQHALYRDDAVQNRGRRQSRLKSVAGKPTRPIVVDQEQLGLRSGRWKFIVTGPVEELYDLASDPQETHNLASERGEVVEELREVLQRKLADHPLHVKEPALINRELRDTLRALGYL